MMDPGISCFFDTHISFCVTPFSRILSLDIFTIGKENQKQKNKKERLVKMRDIKRIDRMLSLLAEGWHKVPDWRFGQLIENFKRYCGVSDLFYIEDDEMEKRIEDFFDLNE